MSHDHDESDGQNHAHALLAQRVAQRARTGQRTFGYRRAEVLAALANGVVLGASSVWIIIEAITRIGEPPHVLGLPMLIVASIGLGLNLISASILSKAGKSRLERRHAPHLDRAQHRSARAELGELIGCSLDVVT